MVRPFLVKSNTTETDLRVLSNSCRGLTLKNNENMYQAGSVVPPWSRLMAIASILRYSLLILPLVVVLALGVNSCAAPEETKTDATATATSSGSQDDNSSSTDELSTTISYKVKGFVQKGPFVQGTEITARELDPTEDYLTPTGRTFTGTIEDNTGRFTAKGKLVHSIVELSANG